MKIRPDIKTFLGVGDPRFANSITAGRAEGILSNNSQYIVTGVILSNPDTGEKFLCDNARCRWRDRDDWHTILNPPQIPSHKPTLKYQ
jgi:hypothetical protein